MLPSQCTVFVNWNAAGDSEAPRVPPMPQSGTVIRCTATHPSPLQPVSATLTIFILFCSLIRRSLWNFCPKLIGDIDPELQPIGRQFSSTRQRTAAAEVDHRFTSGGSRWGVHMERFWVHRPDPKRPFRRQLGVNCIGKPADSQEAERIVQTECQGSGGMKEECQEGLSRRVG